MVGKIQSPEEVHDQCDQSQIDSNFYSNCTLVEQRNLECSKDQCCGQKQVCDCNVYRWLVVYAAYSMRHTVRLKRFLNWSI